MNFLATLGSRSGGLGHSRMGDEGNDFLTFCVAIPRFLSDPQPDRHYLDIACGNGLTSRRLATLGAQVTAFDFSANLIEKANARQNPNSLIDYHVIDTTDGDSYFPGRTTLNQPVQHGTIRHGRY